jgi:hypothetical protein
MSVRVDQWVFLRVESHRWMLTIMAAVSAPVNKFAFGTVISQSGFW